LAEYLREAQLRLGWRLLGRVKALPGERCQYHSRMFFRYSLVCSLEILRSPEAVANGIDMYPQLLGDLDGRDLGSW